MLRKCLSDEKQLASDSLARQYLSRDTTNFWKDVNKAMARKTNVQVTTINGTTGSQNICNLWKEHFSNLLNSTKDSVSQDAVMRDLTSIDSDSEYPIFTVKEVMESIKDLKKGKSTGLDGISAEHILYASDKIAFFLACLFNMMFVHSFLPSQLTDTLLITLLKDKKGIITDKDNYRPIAITTSMSKLLEMCIMTKYNNFFVTNSHQIGFKKGHSTDMSIFLFKETIDFYHSFSSPVYTCYIDASKAFDKVNYWKLFRKLLDRNTPTILVRLLAVWYSSQRFSVLWDNIVSESFKVSNGVRQGGVLSPHLFCIYMEDLSNRLIDTGIGCHINGTCLNHIFYADDAVLLAPTVECLQKLIDVCHMYSLEFDMVYNSVKSCCTSFLPNSLKHLQVPSVYLGQRKLEWVREKDYLGVIICENRSDNADIRRQIKSIYKQGNSIIRRFYMCTDAVKIQLFKTFCYNMYGISLWTNYQNDLMDDASVAYNNIFRQFFKLGRRCSISMEFFNRNINGFYICLRKSINSFYNRLKNSKNTLVRSILNSTYFRLYSTLHIQWQKMLFL